MLPLPHSPVLPPEGSVCAIVVTRDRRELLAGCLERLAVQDRPPEEILVVDNQSSDGTRELLAERFAHVHVLRPSENVGGAGGFHRGMAWAHARGHTWLWLMDDDSWTRPTTLATLLAGARRAPGPVPPALVASQVRWKDGSLHPMNTPWPRWRSAAALADGVEHGLLLLRHATFVSVAVHRDAVSRHGLPLAHYFIWTDDFEYTGRILRDAPGWLVPESVVDHWTERAHTPVVGGGARFYYFVRNGLLLLRGASLTPVEKLHYARMARGFLAGFMAHERWSPAAWHTVARGLLDGLRDPVR